MLAGGLALAGWAGVDLPKVLADSTTAAEVPPWYGAASTAGVILLAAVAGGCLTAGAALRWAGDSRGRFGLATGLLLAIFVADDAFLLHEVVAPRTGIPEVAIVALHACLWAWWAFAFRHRHLVAPVLPVLGAAALAASTVVDLVTGESLRAIVLEDSLKIVGFTTIAAYATRAVLQDLGAALRDARRGPEPVQ